MAKVQVQAKVRYSTVVTIIIFVFLKTASYPVQVESMVLHLQHVFECVDDGHWLFTSRKSEDRADRGMPDFEIDWPRIYALW